MNIDFNKKTINKLNKSPTKKRGKDGEIKVNKNMVSKVFNENKSPKEIIKEYEFMEKAYNLGISPRPFSFNWTGAKYILMEKLDYTLFEEIKKTGELSQKRQREMIKILHLLDKSHIFHGDISPLNFMIKKSNDALYIIDFGMSKKMTSSFIAKHSENANIKQGITVFILKIREVIPSFDPVLLKKEVFKYLKI
jgi:tRNA A-37 threonylcarbamoyl transferase component Bud32